MSLRQLNYKLPEKFVKTSFETLGRKGFNQKKIARNHIGNTRKKENKLLK